ncbi:MAG: hypothetical protein IKW90_00220 [Lachnospiraceae bacterium]|nr:hypothetical protein [Lachnospiraceae bacterium]
MATNKKKSPLGTIVFMVLFAAVVIGIYFAITRNKDNSSTKEIPAETSEADTLIKKDLDWEYPATPREVLKLYCRITKCLYNDDLTDEQIKKLVSQVRNLYSFELLENNAEDEQIAFIKGDRAEYKKDKKTIFSFAIDSASNIEYIDTKAGKTAVIKMYFTLKAGAQMDRSFEEFSLIQQDDGKWKIAAWRLSENEVAIDETD